MNKIRKTIEIDPIVDPGLLLKTSIKYFTITFLILGTALFLSAETFCYWEAWAYLIILIIPAAGIVSYLYFNNPKLLERRLRMKETHCIKKAAIILFWLFIFSVFILSGLDKRFHWSDISYTLIIVFDIIILTGYLKIAQSFLTNHYIWKIVKAERGQKVISSGPYSFVRHPMYAGTIIFFLFSPPALGSYWAMIPALFIIPSLVCRIISEEKELLDNIDDYKKYMAQTRYRLLPGIW